MKNYIQKINLYHSLFFFLLANILSIIIDQSKNLIIPHSFCLFLILTIGISHGSLDNIKGKKLLKSFDIKFMSTFYIGYSLICLFIIIVWIIFPKTLLFIFLIVASYHFGKEDSWGENNSLFIPFELSYFLKGSLIVWLPLWLSFDETLMLFDTLGIKNQEFYNLLIFLSDNKFFPFLVSLSFLVSITLNIETGSSKFKYLPDVIAVYVLYATFNPLIAFTIYFCFLHSVRHSACLINDMKINLVSFIKKAWPLTMLTAILFFGGIYILTGFQKVDIDSSIINVIFIGLASLTFPHILLEYLLEKNEK